MTSKGRLSPALQQIPVHVVKGSVNAGVLGAQVAKTDIFSLPYLYLCLGGGNSAVPQTGWHLVLVLGLQLAPNIYFFETYITPSVQRQYVYFKSPLFKLQKFYYLFEQVFF
jgi:hypothetical protein